MSRRIRISGPHEDELSRRAAQCGLDPDELGRRLLHEALHADPVEDALDRLLPLLEPAEREAWAAWAAARFRASTRSDWAAIRDHLLSYLDNGHGDKTS